MGEIPAEYLPPKEHLPEKIYPLPEVRLPKKLNLAHLALDRNIIDGRGSKVAILYQDRKITCEGVLSLLRSLLFPPPLRFSEGKQKG